MLRQFRFGYWVQRRFYIAKSASKVLSTEKALQHFDDYYGSVFGKSWPSIRLALLCKPKKVALLNDFSVEVEESEETLISLGAKNMRTAVESTMGKNLMLRKSKGVNFKPFMPTTEEDTENLSEDRFALDHFMPISKMKFQEEVISESDYYSFYHDGSKSVEYCQDEEFVFPTFWKPMSFPRGNISNFPKPIRDNIDLYPMKIIDGSALLPVMALDICAGDDIADLCAGPGDKSVAILLTMCPKSLHLNDASSSQLKKTKQAVENHIPDFFLKHVELNFSQCDVCTLKPTKEFHKILLDVPCMDDRRSVNDEEDNFFSGSMVKKRNDLPHYLSNMVTSALSMLKEGGSLVYTTSTLSPILNDGVVQDAVINAASSGSKFVVNDMRQCIKPLSVYFKMDLTFHYGVLVLPFVPNNFGPTYFSKITCISK